MSLIFSEGFDNWTPIATAILGKWQTAQVQTGTTLGIVSGGRNGGNCLRFTFFAGTTGTVGSYLQRVLAAPLARTITGLAIRINAFDITHEMPLLQWCDVVTPQVTLAVMPNGQLKLYGGGPAGIGTLLATSSSSVFQTGVWHFVELDLTFNSSTGAFTVNIDGVQVLSGSGVNTAPAGDNSANTFRLGWMPSGSAGIVCSYDYDDLYTNSAAGAVNNGMLGDTRIVTLFPNGEGTTDQFTPVGASPNYACVDQQTEDGDTTYVSSATVGNKDLYTKNPTPTNTGQIFGINVWSVARKDDAGSRYLSNVILSGSTESDAAGVSLSEDYAWYSSIYEQDPDAMSAWTKTTLDAAQVGVKVAS